MPALNPNNSYRNINYGFSQPLNQAFPIPVIANRAPTANDIGYPLLTLWDDKPANAVFILTSVASGAATWLDLTGAGGAGVFTSLLVNPGPTIIVGNTSVNTAGAGTTDIAGTTSTGDVTVGFGSGTVHIGGGTGAVDIGSDTGNVTIGTNSSSGIITVGAGTGATVIGSGGGSTTIGTIAGGTGVVGALTVTGGSAGATLYSTGDLGGFAAETGITNVNVPVAGGTGAFTLTSTSGAGTGTNAGYIKAYVGTTPIFIPYFLATT